MRKLVAACFIIAFASVFGVACGGGGAGQQQDERIDLLEEQVEELREEVEEIEVLLGEELEEEPKQEQTQPERTS